MNRSTSDTNPNELTINIVEALDWAYLGYSDKEEMLSIKIK